MISWLLMIHHVWVMPLKYLVTIKNYILNLVYNLLKECAGAPSQLEKSKNCKLLFPNFCAFFRIKITTVNKNVGSLKLHFVFIHFYTTFHIDIIWWRALCAIYFNICIYFWYVLMFLIARSSANVRQSISILVLSSLVPNNYFFQHTFKKQWRESITFLYICLYNVSNVRTCKRFWHYFQKCNFQFCIS